VYLILYVLLTAAAVFGAAVLVASCALLIRRKSRAWGFAVIAGGVLGAVLSVAFFVLLTFVIDSGRDAISTHITARFLGAGFGVGGTLGALAYLSLRVLQSPNRWVDRRRAGHTS
jgi:hypothetical protein